MLIIDLIFIVFPGGIHFPTPQKFRKLGIRLK